MSASTLTVEHLSRSTAVTVTEIEDWVRLSWLRPTGEPGRWLFEEVDLARTRLIVELRTLSIDDEAMPVILSLLDQLYATRAELRRVLTALEHAPPALRQALLPHLAPPHD